MEKNTFSGSDRYLLSKILFDRNICLSRNPRGTDKGDPKCYVKYFYENQFYNYRQQKVRLLEIGVRSGASLVLWANYFPDIEIIGLDVEEIGSANGPILEYLNYHNVQFSCKDAYQPNTADDIEGKFTILIDDGPHTLNSQIAFLKLYLDKLEQNGILIIEDILFPYRDCYQLMNSLPKGNKYIFEIHDFEKIQVGGGFLFVVRHNLENKNMLFKKSYVTIRAFLELLQVFKRRMLRGDFSFKNRRIN